MALAQEQAPRAPRGERGERGARQPGQAGVGEGRERAPGGGQFDPAQMRERMQQMMATRVRQQLGASDEEWAVIEPLLIRVNDLRRPLRGAMGRGRGRAEAAPAEGQEVDPLTQAMNALRAAMEVEGTTPEVVKARLDELRAVQATRREQLKLTQDELRAVLTVRQEAQMVLNGTLD